MLHAFKGKIFTQPKFPNIQNESEKSSEMTSENNRYNDTYIKPKIVRHRR